MVKLMRKMNCHANTDCSSVIVIAIVTTGASCLGKLLKVNNSLQELVMYSNSIGDDGISALADGLQHNNTLAKLNVSRCKFSVKGNYSYCIVYKM